MKKLLIKWLCPKCKDCIQDISMVYFGSTPTLNESLYYLLNDENGNGSYNLLPDGEYLHNNKKLIIKNEVVAFYDVA